LYDQPFAVEAWYYYLDNKLVGLGFVDTLPGALSAIYFSYDPAILPRSPGIWNVLRMIEEAKRRGLPHVYLGYWIAESRKMAYKIRFQPMEGLIEGRWRPLEE